MCHDGSVPYRLVFPDALVNISHGEDLAPVFQEQLQDLIFCIGKNDQLISFFDRLAAKVQRKILVKDRMRVRRRVFRRR